MNPKTHEQPSDNTTQTNKNTLRYWQTWVRFHWLKAWLEQLSTRLRALSRLRGRSARSQRIYRGVVQAALALMLTFSMLASPLSPAYAAGAAFTERTGGANPFNGVNVGTYSAPSFVDVDADGDIDAFIGKADGNLNYYQNTHCSFRSENSGALTSGDVLHFGNGNSRITVKVNSVGNPALTNIIVACNASTHANATANMTAGAYWRITPNAGAGTTIPFNLDLTMPFKAPVSGEDKLCRYTGGPGAGWECTQDSFTATTITQNGVGALSDWTVGDNVGPTALELKSFTAQSDGADVTVGAGLLAAAAAAFVALRSRFRKQRK